MSAPRKMWISSEAGRFSCPKTRSERLMSQRTRPVRLNNGASRTSIDKAGMVLGREKVCSRNQSKIADTNPFMGVDRVCGFANIPDPRLISVAGRGLSRAIFDKSAVGMPRGCFAQDIGHDPSLKRNFAATTVAADEHPS